MILHLVKFYDYKIADRNYRIEEFGEYQNIHILLKKRAHRLKYHVMVSGRCHPERLEFKLRPCDTKKIKKSCFWYTNPQKT